MTEQESKEQALQEYRKKLLQHKEIDAKVRTLREQMKQSKKEYDKTEDDLKALQSVGQIIAEVLRQLDEERCKSLTWPVEQPFTAGRVKMLLQSCRQLQLHFFSAHCKVCASIAVPSLPLCMQSL